MAAPSKYPDELRERATRMAVEARRNPVAPGSRTTATRASSTSPSATPSASPKPAQSHPSGRPATPRRDRHDPARRARRHLPSPPGRAGDRRRGTCEPLTNPGRFASSIPDQRPQRHCPHHLASTISQAPSRHCSSGIREDANTRVSVRETAHTVPCCALPSGSGGAPLTPGLNRPGAQAVQLMATARTAR